MTRYRNGHIPRELLVHMGGEHWATPATATRIRALIADIKQNEGVTVWVTGGPNIYRDYANQVATKKHFTYLGKPWIAAAPGSSSHGGTFKGRDCLAADFSGYAVLGIDKWFRYLRKHGFEAGYYDGKNGRPYEPWHAIDWNPYTAPAPAGNISKPTTKPVKPEEDEDEDMAMKGASYTRASDKTTVFLLFNEVSGFYVEHTGVGGDYNNSIAGCWDTNSWAPITESHATVIKRSLDAVRRTAVTGSLSVDISNAA